MVIVSADPDQMPQNVAPDQNLHYLQIVKPFFSMNSTYYS